jgi:uncharacterized protein (TIGR02271 family)
MKTVVGLFKNFGQAEDAMGELAKIGLSKQEIGLLASTRISNDAKPPSPMSLLDLPDLGQVAANGPMLRLLDASRLQKSSEGMRGALEHIGLGKSEAAQCVDGLRRGGTLEAVVVEDDKEAEAVAIMRRYAGNGSIREGSAGGAIRERASEQLAIREGGVIEELRERKAELRERKAELGDTRERTTEEVVIPIIEEELRVGKREYDAGGLRVKTRVASVPVDKTVTLREEHVKVERRVIDRPVALDDDVFRERTLDLRASAEEPLLSKEARVVEEIHLRKDASERVETIHDTLRHTDVQISEIPAKSRFNPSRYLDHFKRTYEPERYTFDWVSPAYEFGEQLRYRSSGSDWSQIEPTAKSMWEGKNPGTWERFREAIKPGWETAGR